MLLDVLNRTDDALVSDRSYKLKTKHRPDWVTRRT